MLTQPYLLVVNGENLTVARFNALSGSFIDTLINSSAFPTQYPLLYWLTGIEVGPDGNIYIADFDKNRVARFRASDGIFLGDFVTQGSGGLDGPGGLTFGPDGHLYVSSKARFSGTYPLGEILRYDGNTGAFLGAFVSAATPGKLTSPLTPIFGPDGNLYVCDRHKHRVMRYDGATGAFLDVFVAEGSGGLYSPSSQAFGPDGNLYVSHVGGILRFDGTTGALIDSFVSWTGFLGLLGLRFGPDGFLYACGGPNSPLSIYDIATGALQGPIDLTHKSGVKLPFVLAFGERPLPLPDVPELSRRVPRWLQVIGIAVIVIAIGRAVLQLAGPLRQSLPMRR